MANKSEADETRFSRRTHPRGGDNRSVLELLQPGDGAIVHGVGDHLQLPTDEVHPAAAVPQHQAAAPAGGARDPRRLMEQGEGERW